MNSQEFFKLFRLEHLIKDSNDTTFVLGYKSFFNLNDTEVVFSVLENNLIGIFLQTQEFGEKLDILNITLDLKQNIKIDSNSQFKNEIFPFLTFQEKNIDNDLTYLSQMIYNILIPKHELQSNIAYYGESRF